MPTCSRRASTERCAASTSRAFFATSAAWDPPGGRLAASAAVTRSAPPNSPHRMWHVATRTPARVNFASSATAVSASASAPMGLPTMRRAPARLLCSTARSMPPADTDVRALIARV
eukprot:84102-Chlamydomonas_euryale.AAC.1